MAQSFAICHSFNHLPFATQVLAQHHFLFSASLLFCCQHSAKARFAIVLFGVGRAQRFETLLVMCVSIP